MFVHSQEYNVYKFYNKKSGQLLTIGHTAVVVRSTVSDIQSSRGDVQLH